MTVEGFDTEGLLIIANITKCKEYYSRNAFNYDYPKGLADLLIKGIIHIITTKEVVEQIDFVFSKEAIHPDVWEYKASYNYLDVAEEDEIRLISHAAFTRMCNNHKGDLKAKIEHSLHIRNLLNPDRPVSGEAVLEDELPLLELAPGLWRINVYTLLEESLSGWPEFMLLLQKTDAVDLSKITLEPLEIYE